MEDIHFILDKALIPYLSQIDLLEESVIKLEQTAYKLDSYSKELGKDLVLTQKGCLIIDLISYDFLIFHMKVD